jgi:hypothetical protein
MQITIEVPDRLGEQLQQLGDRFPEALIHALQELTSTETTADQDDSQIVEPRSNPRHRPHTCKPNPDHPTPCDSIKKHSVR